MSIRIIICKGVHLLGGCLGPDTLGTHDLMNLLEELLHAHSCIAAVLAF